MMRRGMALALGVLAAGGAARAEVVAKAPSGFATRTVTEIAAPPDRVWAALMDIGRWWNPSHSYSGAAGALSLKAEAGGCFCERWPGGAVQHATVVMAMPNQTLRLSGGLGPLQAEGAAAAWSFALQPSATGTTLTQTMTVGGWAAPGLDGFAIPVDAVLTEQQGRLKRYVETGKPEPGAP